LHLAVRDDAPGERGADARDAGEQRRARGVELDAHGVHAALHHLVELAGEQRLIHVVLVLPHADGLGVDLHQLGERVLQAARDGDGPAHREVEVGKLLAGDVRGRVHARARLVHRVT
jgi:hypothetical protein